ncbi:laccase-6, partial [Cephus cinctus]|uniref:Laccase-6 n=1 Tax=Cephus cinctus TaxID=211228 RepID=A0AAJ7CFJ5_CEPCN
PGDGVGLVSIINNISNVFPPSPPLSQGISEFCNGDNLPRNCSTHYECTHVLEVKRHSVVEVMLYDISVLGLYHPFHLHGYDFYVFDMGNFTSNDTEGNVKSILANHENKLRNGGYKNPPGKDTVLLPSGGYVILRFKADNPGWWLFHCHIVFHMIVGMDLIFHVGNDYVDLPPVPPFFPRCYNFKPKPFFNMDPFFI